MKKKNKFILLYEEFTKKQLEELTRLDKTYVKKLEKNVKDVNIYGNITNDIRNYDVSNFKYILNYGIYTIYPDNNFIEIIKKYNEKLRWTTKGHENSSDIFLKEIKMLQKIQHSNHVPKVISYEDKTIKMSYEGESLYNNFKLPKDWKEQIKEIFDSLTENKIYYPEFRLQNILVLNKKIKFVDFGLAEFKENVDNTENCNKFVKYLEVLNKRLKKTKDKNERYKLCTTLFNNMKN